MRIWAQIEKTVAGWFPTGTESLLRARIRELELIVDDRARQSAYLQGEWKKAADEVTRLKAELTPKQQKAEILSAIKAANRDLEARLAISESARLRMQDALSELTTTNARLSSVIRDLCKAEVVEPR